MVIEDVFGHSLIVYHKLRFESMLLILFAGGEPKLQQLVIWLGVMAEEDDVLEGWHEVFWEELLDS